MLQTIRRESPRQVTPEDLSDTSLLGAGEHGEAIVVDQHPVGQWPGHLQTLGLRLPGPLALASVQPLRTRAGK
jgi:hypothetical protein